MRRPRSGALHRRLRAAVARCDRRTPNNAPVGAEAVERGVPSCVNFPARTKLPELSRETTRRPFGSRATMARAPFAGSSWSATPPVDVAMTPIGPWPWMPAGQPIPSKAWMARRPHSLPALKSWARAIVCIGKRSMSSGVLAARRSPHAPIGRRCSTRLQRPLLRSSPSRSRSIPRVPPAGSSSTCWAWRDRICANNAIEMEKQLPRT